MGIKDELEHLLIQATGNKAALMAAVALQDNLILGLNVLIERESQKGEEPTAEAPDTSRIISNVAEIQCKHLTRLDASSMGNAGRTECNDCGVLINADGTIQEQN